MTTQNMLAYLFDTSKMNDVFYGAKAFSNFIDGMEITSNNAKTIFSEGDIIDSQIYTYEQIVIKDRLCTVNRTGAIGKIHVIVVEDIDTDIATKIDSRLKSNCVEYLGMTSINHKASNRYKQYWKDLIRSFSIEGTSIVTFNSEDEDVFLYKEIALSKGFSITCDGFPMEYYPPKNNLLPISRQSSFIKEEVML